MQYIVFWTEICGMRLWESFQFPEQAAKKLNELVDTKQIENLEDAYVFVDCDQSYAVDGQEYLRDWT